MAADRGAVFGLKPVSPNFYTNMSMQQVTNIIREIQDLCGKPHIRCPRHEEFDAPKLAAQLVHAATTLSHNLLTKVTVAAPSQAATKLADELTLTANSPRPINVTKFKRNLKLVFLGPHLSSLDSKQIATRKRTLQDRCNTILSLHPGHIILWSTTLRTSTWAAGEMSNDDFDYLKGKLSGLPLPSWQADVANVLRAMSSEEPLATCEKFESFLNKFKSSLSSADAAKPSTIRNTTLNACDVGNKRPRDEDAHPSTSNDSCKSKKPKMLSSAIIPHKRTARMARVAKLEQFLGGFLYTGMEATSMRRQEVKNRITSLTDAVRLHLARESGEDFELEIWLCHAVATAITQAERDSSEQMRSILGRHLFEAMSTAANDINVSVPYGENADCKLSLTVAFNAGRDLLDELFPS